MLLAGGNLGDRIGRRRILQAGLALFALTSVGAALSRTTAELIAGRAAMGAAAALIYPATPKTWLTAGVRVTNPFR